MKRSPAVLLTLTLLGAAPVAAQEPVPAASEQSSAAAQEASGREAGKAAGSSLSGGWFAKGLVGGLVGGPIGTGVAFAMAGRSDIQMPAPVAQDAAARTPVFSRAFREAYEEQVRMKRRESAFVGGMLGTAVWTWLVLRTVDLIGGGDLTGDPGDPDPGF